MIGTCSGTHIVNQGVVAKRIDPNQSRCHGRRRKLGDGSRYPVHPALAGLDGAPGGVHGLCADRSGILRGGQHKPDLRSFCSRGQRLAGHQFDRWPVLLEKAPCIVEIVGLDSNAASLSAGAVRDLKVKIEPDRVVLDRLIIAAHLASPPFCVVHSNFAILIFTRRDYGGLGALKRRLSAAGTGGRCLKTIKGNQEPAPPPIAKPLCRQSNYRNLESSKTLILQA